VEPTRKPRGSSLRRQVPPKTDVYLPNVLHFLDNRQTGDVLKDPEVSITEVNGPCFHKANLWTERNNRQKIGTRECFRAYEADANNQSAASRSASVY